MICEQCGKEFMETFGSNRFCSRKCANHYSRKFVKKKSVYYNTEERACEKCGKKFYVDLSKENKNRRKRFCSHSWANGHIVTEAHKKKVSLSMKKFYSTKEGMESRRKSQYRNKQLYIENPNLRKQQSDRVLQSKYNVEDINEVYVDFICPVCGKHMCLTKYQARKRKYCSGHCRNVVNNARINGSRSKAEKLLESMIKTKFPSLIFKTNDRMVLDGLELDFYFPSINLAIEWNGIFHYKDLGHNFKLIQEKDIKKIDMCKDKNIELYVVKDLTSSIKFIKEEINKIEKLLISKIQL